MKCIRCNQENPDGNVFCSACGNKMDNANQNMNTNINVQPVLNQNNNVPPKKNNVVLPIIIVLVLLVGIVGLYSVIKNMTVNEKDNNIEENIDEKVEENKTVESVTVYNVGNEITLVDGSSWYYISGDNNKVVLLSKSNHGSATYFCSDGKNMYETSHVKDVVENEYLPTIKASILASNGNVDTTTARILSVDDIKQITNSTETDPKNIEIGNEYKWLFETGNYWLSTHSYDSLYNSVYIIQSWVTFANVNLDIAGLNMGWGNEFNVRPVLETSINNIRK